MRFLLLFIICSVQLCAFTYQKVLYDQESAVFLAIAKKLHGANEVVDPIDLRRALDSLLKRVQAEKITHAVGPLQDAIYRVGSPSPGLIYKDVMEAWYFTDPEHALAFLFIVIQDEINRVLNNQESAVEYSVTKVDYQLLVRFLSIIIEKNRTNTLSKVLESLNNKIEWFDYNPRRDFIFFTMSLELDWMKTVLLIRTTSFANIIDCVDFQVSLQQKMIELSKFRSDRDYDKEIDLIAAMQTQLSLQILKGLATIRAQGPRISEAETILFDIAEAAPKQRQQYEGMTRLLTKLQQVSNLLHGRAGHAQAEDESQMPDQKIAA